MIKFLRLPEIQRRLAAVGLPASAHYVRDRMADGSLPSTRQGRWRLVEANALETFISRLVTEASVVRPLYGGDGTMGGNEGHRTASNGIERRQGKAMRRTKNPRISRASGEIVEFPRG